MKNQFLETRYEKSSNVLYCTWSKETQKATWAEMSDTMIKYVEDVEKHSPYFILIDERQLQYPWLPDQQEWVDKNIVPRSVAVGVKKHAIIQSSDIFIATSVEQMMSEQNAQELTTQFFDNFKSAEEWILSE